MSKFLLMALAIVGCVSTESNRSVLQKIPPSHSSLLYEGRVLRARDSAAIYYSGSGITFNFKGTSANALLKDQNGQNYFNVVLDGDSIRPLKLDSVKRDYELVSGLSDTVHSISLLKRNEWDKGQTWFYGLTIRGELTAPPARSGKKIEFFGNSITAGYAIENYTGGDSPDSTFTNNYFSYAALTARHFDADYTCTCRSGIGITVSWFPVVMPEVFDRLDPLDPASKWDFGKYQPDIVVVNLFQNDSWLVNLPDHPSFKERFGDKAPTSLELIEAYRQFIRNIREKYPNAHIICALGSMDATKAGSPWPGYVAEAVTPLNDQKIHTLVFPFTNKGGHPRKEDNKVMADMLITFIERNIWK